ncbi:MAG: aminotransferase class III-fold pyridoxal phosphate-dependent enzyme [Gemmatimonadaceae bacterium]|nr:aminotransferase class III-fold pyridoxal phosphate-dependent enzyme [Gemmatimonadaceae bacterium]
MLDFAPRFDEAAAARVARERFGLDGTARALFSERDQNFLIDAGAAGRIVLKIANATEDPAVVDAQQRALSHLAGQVDFTPRIVPASDGELVVRLTDGEGRAHLVWAMTCLPGSPLGEMVRPSAALLSSLGRSVARLDTALAGFDHPAVHRDFAWDLAHARRAIDERRALVRDAPLGRAIDDACAAFDRCTAPHLGSLRRCVIHNDLNDYNVLVGWGGAPGAADQRVTGIVDFGDMIASYAVADLATAIAYAVLDAPDPLAPAATVVTAYHAVRPLTEAELRVLYGLVAVRLCLSACMAAVQMSQRPDNAYLGISQQRVRRALPRLAATSFPLAEAVFRHACGLAPVPASARVVSWLDAHAADFAPVLGVDLRTGPSLVLDWSVGSPDVSGDPAERDESHLTPLVLDAMRRAGVRAAVGRYDEPRLLYVTPLFSGGDRVTDERRTIHIGLDLFAPAGTPVFAPLAGAVHAFADNAQPLDYGPVVILRHQTDDGTEFFTLYGHLDRASLAGLAVGQAVARGARIGALGTADVNGGWTPHLHLQVIVDLLGFGLDLPGVARASQRPVWRAVCPDPNLLVGVSARQFPPPERTPDQTLAARRAHFGGNLSLAYRAPLKLVRGWKQYLFDDSGRQYVDAYNNVPHVGHAHPRVVRAAYDQMRVLNTNTRYLNDVVVEYADRLVATLPAPLGVCYFTNSATEANDLALRLARAYTGARDLIVLEAAYHGNSSTLIDISPYKHAGPGGAGAPPWVHVAPIPDDFRGPFRRADPHAGARYAARVGELAEGVRAAGRPLCGFIAETCPSVGGQILPPAGYFSEAYRHVRAAGGVCIADEVQTGLGRLGAHWWAFEAHGVVPDIVVMGKPLGNGHPLAAVVTTRAIADAFDNGMEYFNTFGGNTVSCAVGLAVLDVMRDEGLQDHARRVGERLLAGLRPLADRYELVGDVRGSGLFLGVELVRDRVTLEPAAAEAAYVANRLRERGILLGTDGPYHNVVKIRPPMPFDEHDADLLVEEVDQVLRELRGA